MYTNRQKPAPPSRDLFSPKQNTTPQFKPAAQPKGRHFWGPAGWTFIHSIAASYTPENAEYYKMFMLSLTRLLPCTTCKKNLIKHLSKLPLEPYLANNHELLFHSYALHDMSNKDIEQETRQSKPSPPYDEFKAFIIKSLGDECGECKAL
jgi:hypothetical protein